MVITDTAGRRDVGHKRRRVLLRRALLALPLAAGASHYAMPALLRRAFRVPRGPVTMTLPPAGEVVSIPGPRSKRLAGNYLEPAGRDSSAAVLVMHGWGGNSQEMARVAPPLSAAGIAVLFVDARCHGSSDEDDFASMPRFAEDIECGLEWLATTHGISSERVVLLGHSVGAGAALLVASRRRVGGVVALASMAHPAQLMTQLLTRARLPRLLIRYLLWRIEGLVGLRFDDFAPLSTIRRVDAPVLLLHGDRDETVPLSDARALHAAAAGRDVQLVVVEGANHRSDDAFLSLAPDIVTFVRNCVGIDA